jgi:hypothetical protein
MGYAPYMTEEWPGPNAASYLVVYEDGSEQTVRGYTISYIADVCSDDNERGDVVKIERLKRSEG